MKHFAISFVFIFLIQFSFCQDSITVTDIRSAEKIASIRFTADKEDSLLGMVQDRSKEYDKMHRYALNNAVPITMAQSPMLPFIITSRDYGNKKHRHHCSR